MKIDWIHAPDWAEAVGVRLYKSGGVGHAFICSAGYNYKLELGKTAKCHPFNDGHAIGDFSIIEFRPKTSALTWNGKGLPPVGKAACEYRGAHQYDLWTVVDIFAHWGKDVFVDYGDGWRAERDLDRFRPIRTLEQIAAEEREAAVVEIERIALSGGTYKTMAEALYDAGYRKLETVDDDRA